MRPSIYDHSHAPAEHFARLGYAAISATLPLGGWPDDEYEDDHPGAQRRWQDLGVLAVIRGERPAKEKKKPRKTDGAEADARAQRHSFAGYDIDWPMYLPELKTWAGRATTETIVTARQRALYGPKEEPTKLPEGESLLSWSVPLDTCSGIDARVAPNALDDGFSVAKLGMLIYAFAAVELLAIVGLQIAPVTRVARKRFAYRDDRGQWWEFGIREREGQHRVTTMAERSDLPWH